MFKRRRFGNLQGEYFNQTLNPKGFNYYWVCILWIDVSFECKLEILLKLRWIDLLSSDVSGLMCALGILDVIDFQY